MCETSLGLRLRRRDSVVGRIVLAIAIIAGMGVFPGTGSAQDLGLTPSQVVSLWTNVNTALIAAAELGSNDAGLAQRLKATRPTTAQGKTPADVLGQVVAFRGKLDQLRGRSGLDATKQYGEGEGVVSPTVVYLNSGMVLDGLTHWLGKKAGPERLVGEFYTRYAITGKTPSDAYAMAELANRRIDLLLAETGG
jgi:hypothetical protein